MHDCQRRYIQMTLDLWFGAVTLTIFSPTDALWICEQIHQLTDDLRTMRSGIVHVGTHYIVLERESDQNQLNFLAQCFRTETDYYSPPILEILVHHSVN